MTILSHVDLQMQINLCHITAGFYVEIAKLI